MIIIKKFVFLYVGDSGDDSMEAWMGWFKSLGDKVVDAGNPFGKAREGSKDLDHGSDSITGYSIVNAKDIDEAVELTKTCPSGIVRVYEAMPM